MRHARRGGDIGDRQRGIGGERRCVPAFARERAARGLYAARGVDLLDPLDHLEQPRPPGDAIGLERGGHGKADGLFRAALVGDDQIGGQRVQPALDALHRGVKGFQVDRKIGALGHGGISFR